jgi:myo-inositol-1-phosphate synthase
MGQEINVAIVGVGNCASSLVQGIEFYKDAAEGQSIPGLMHPVLGGYRIRDIRFTTARSSTEQAPGASQRSGISR